MSLNIWELNYVMEVAKTGSISKAAQNLFLSQPHLSNTIKTVEKELGVTLFRRSTKGMTLTEEGRIFIKQANNILSEFEVLKAVFRSRPEETVRVRVSVTRSYQINRCMSDFINKHDDKGNFVIHIKETNPFQVIKDVRYKDAEFGILHFFDAQKDYFINQFNMHSIEYKFQYDREFLLAMSVNNPLSRVDVITEDMLAKQIAIVYGDYEIPSASYEIVTEISDIMLSEKRIYVYERATAMETLSRCKSTYMWITGLHPETLEKEGLVLRRCKDVNVRNLGYSIQLSDVTLSAACQELLGSMEKVDWSENVTV